MKNIINNDLVVWDDGYRTGIELIDNQHKVLVDLTNKLFQACRGRDGEEELHSAFKTTMGNMVEYVRFHFSAEEDMLRRINYPKFSEHKKQHEALIQMILDSVKDHMSGKPFIPNRFVRNLRDWIFGHIAVSDKDYAIFYGKLHEGVVA